MKTRKILTMLTVMMLVGTMTGCGTNADLTETGKAEKQETIDKSKEQDKLAHLDAEEKTAEKETADKSAESKNKAEKESDKKTAETSSKDETKSETANSSTQETVKETNSSNTVSNQNMGKTETSKEAVKAPSNKNEENKNTSSNSNKTPTQTNKQPAKEETKKPAVENTKPAHTHSWVEVTEKYTIPAKTHEEVVYKTERYEIEPARDEEVLAFVGRECLDCGYRTSINSEMAEHMLEYAHTCHIVEEYETIHHEAVYGERKVPNGTKVVVDEPAKTGTRVTGYKCSCGATKTNNK